jgi:large subunit ribosomal protein L10
MNREQKATAIAEIADQIQESEAIFAVDYRGITVAQVADLRTKLTESDTSLRVVKNTLSERAADQTGTEALKPLLAGPTALAFVRGDVAGAAKALADAQKTTTFLAFKGGVLNGEALDAAQITALSKLPSRDVLYQQLVGLVASPLTGLARTLNQLIGGVAAAARGRRSGDGRRGHAELLLERLDALRQLQHGDALQLFDPFSGGAHMSVLLGGLVSGVGRLPSGVLRCYSFSRLGGRGLLGGRLLDGRGGSCRRVA